MASKRVLKAPEPLVSVIIPAYNSEKYVGDAIRSALNQTYNNIEVIVVDNGSTDRTKDAIDRCIKSNKTGKEIFYVSSKKKGLSLARNLGIKRSSGKYVAFLDADDMWYPQKIKKQVSMIKTLGDSYGLIYTWVKPISAEGLTNRHIENKRKHTLKNLIQSSFIITSSCMIPKKVLDDVGIFKLEYDKIGTVQDLDLFIRIAKKYKIALCDEILTYYRIHKTQVSKELKSYEARIYLYSSFLDDPKLKKYRYIMQYKILKNKIYVKYLKTRNSVIKSPNE
jgi:glycosyltransferase involved in cell wall biosynthesis